MQMDYGGRSSTTGVGRVWTPMIRLAGLLLLAVALLAMMIVGLFLVLPVMLVGGLALSIYIRRQVRREQQRQSQEGVIDAEYTVIERAQG
ncbi:Flp pilus assembly protein TadB [Microvirga lupini]|uniref:Flp pilus assembly protein TadB n=1 Tax=Microvirga lupini TaxID=420324 RepID=A0A7W4VR50_9HYPH|nr:Flp pilus assembly protein TadB [Microvirga lupini]